MATKHGNATNVVKLELENILLYNTGAIKDIGKFIFDSAGSGTYTAGADALETTGDDLVVRANQAIKSTSAIGITIVGTDQTAAALTGTATIAALVSEDQSYEVVVPAGKKWKTITSVTCSNGVRGDGFDLAVLPASANDVILQYDQGISANPGKEVKAIYDKFVLAHNKRIRGDRTLTVTVFYENALKGLSRIHNRDVTLIQQVKDDGGNAVSEYRYYEKVRLSVPLDFPSAPDGEATVKADGTYGRCFVFS